MRIRVRSANLTKPGCDFFSGSRSLGFSLCLMAISTHLALSFDAKARTGSPPVPKRLYVGSPVTEAFVLQDSAKPVPERSIVVTPAGAAVVHVSKPSSPEGVFEVSVLFKLPGRVTIQLPPGAVRNERGGSPGIVRRYEILPWPRVPAAASKGGVIRAGAGVFAATLTADPANVEAGAPMRIDLNLNGSAALAVEKAPELRIRSVDDSSAIHSAQRPMLVDESVDWGDGLSRLPRRSWSYEWRAKSPGAYRVEPLRFEHLDSTGQMQTRLVAGPQFLVRPRAFYRAENQSNGMRPDPEVSDRNFTVIEVVVLALLLSSVLAVGMHRFRDSGWSMKWRIDRLLRQASTQEQALDAWRRIEPAWKRRGDENDPALRTGYEEIRRRAFGRNERRPESVAACATDVRGVRNGTYQNPIR